MGMEREDGCVYRLQSFSIYILFFLSFWDMSGFGARQYVFFGLQTLKKWERWRSLAKWNYWEIPEEVKEDGKPERSVWMRESTKGRNRRTRRRGTSRDSRFLQAAVWRLNVLPPKQECETARHLFHPLWRAHTKGSSSPTSAELYSSVS